MQWPYATGGNGTSAVWYNGKQVSAARVMCTIAHGEPPTPQHETAHNCGKGHEACIHPKHLRWATPKENNADKIIHGTFKKGEDFPWAKLTVDQVRGIRANNTPASVLASSLGVREATIHDVRKRRRWAWLD